MIDIRFNDVETFDKVVEHSLPEGGDLTIVTKDHATRDGNPAAVLTWTVQTRDGKYDRVQAAVTVRLLLQALHALMGRYSHLANAKETDSEPGLTLHGTHRGVAFDAIGVEQVWFVSIEGADGYKGIAKTRADAQSVAAGLIDRMLEGGRISDGH